MRTSEERLSAFVSVIVKPKQMTDSGSDELFSAEVQLADYRVNCHNVQLVNCFWTLKQLLVEFVVTVKVLE